MLKKFNLLLFVLACFLLIQTVSAQVRFKVKLDPSLVRENQPVSGRLLIFITKDTKPTEFIRTGFVNASTFVAGMEVSNLDMGKIVEVNSDAASFPKKLSELEAGEYQAMALLDTNHSYTYSSADAGDIYSQVVKIKVPNDSLELTLSKVLPERDLPKVANVKIVEFESPMLSNFWGKPIKMQASVFLPPDYETSKEKYPTVYSIHGYGGNHLGILRRADEMTKAMQEGKLPKMIYVYLNANSSLGHHVFADSVNNGPWGAALEKEFIPHLEKQFRMDAKPSGRFLTGHSSGGWSSLWVMVTHPDFFGGTWSTAPDPVDFRNFTGVDIYRESSNAYKDEKGETIGLVRRNGQYVASLKEFAQQEYVTGYFGGQMASFDAVFSPKGADGQPMKLYDRETGRVDPTVAKAWEKYDINLLLQRNRQTLLPKLKGKLNIIVGTQDTFRLEEAVRLLDAELKKLGSDARIEYIEGRDHGNLYEGGLREKIAWEMYKIARPNAKAVGK